MLAAPALTAVRHMLAVQTRLPGRLSLRPRVLACGMLQEAVLQQAMDISMTHPDSYIVAFLPAGGLPPASSPPPLSAARASPLV